MICGHRRELILAQCKGARMFFAPNTGSDIIMFNAHLRESNVPAGNIQGERNMSRASNGWGFRMFFLVTLAVGIPVSSIAQALLPDGPGIPTIALTGGPAAHGTAPQPRHPR